MRAVEKYGIDIERYARKHRSASEAFAEIWEREISNYRYIPTLQEGREIMEDLEKMIEGRDCGFNDPFELQEIIARIFQVRVDSIRLIVRVAGEDEYEVKLADGRVCRVSGLTMESFRRGEAFKTPLWQKGKPNPYGEIYAIIEDTKARKKANGKDR